jgi:hypothetical protein
MNARLNLLLSVVVLSSCGFGGIGNGAIQSSTREVPAFQKVAVHSGFKARLVLGPQSVVVRTDENLMPFVEVKVEDGVLHVGMEPFSNPLPSQLEVEISSEALEGLAASGAADVVATATPTDSFVLTASGASDVELKGLSTRALDVSASGASKVQVSGTATEGSVDASGASLVTLTDVVLETLRIDVSGASTLHARVTGEVRGSVSGASGAFVSGNPRGQVDASGASTWAPSAD